MTAEVGFQWFQRADRPEFFNVAQQKIMESCNGWMAYQFACRFNSRANIEGLQEVVIEHGSPSICALFAIDVSGANVTALQEIVLKEGEPGDLITLLQAPGADMDKLDHAIKYCGDEDFKRAYAQTKRALNK